MKKPGGSMVYTVTKGAGSEYDGYAMIMIFVLFFILEMISVVILR